MVLVINNTERNDYPKHEQVYIGRGSALGNPFTSIQDRQTLATEVCGSREESINKYKTYLMQRIADKDPMICMELNSIFQRAQRGKVYLRCYCKPLSCHGDFIKELIDAKLRQ